MKLKEYYGKKVNIASKLNGNFSGTVIGYCFPEDNESGKESIIVKTDNGVAVEFEETDIEHIVFATPGTEETALPDPAIIS